MLQIATFKNNGVEDIAGGKKTILNTILSGPGKTPEAIASMKRLKAQRQMTLDWSQCKGVRVVKRVRMPHALHAHYADVFSTWMVL